MADTASETAKLIFGDQTVDLPVYGGSVGPQAVDITSFYRDTGAFTYDPGFTSTASCESEITYIDGDEGVLLYRGYPIDQLAENGLFAFGQLWPAADQADRIVLYRNRLSCSKLTYDCCKEFRLFQVGE